MSLWMPSEANPLNYATTSWSAHTHLGAAGVVLPILGGLKHAGIWVFAGTVLAGYNLPLSTSTMSLLFVAAIAAGVRAWFLEREVRKRITTLAYIEQRRSRILEDINMSRPLTEIIESITELVSARLGGAPSWCQIAGGAQVGAPPSNLHNMRIADHTIHSRTGHSLGQIFAAFAPGAHPDPAEEEALAMAAGLATLAVETSRLYSDLVHRSEFDLLTDIPNRFSFGQRLDRAIEIARQNASIFGLIFIDLDGFKQVNDLFGHQAGDLYLQEAAQRFKRQLRPGDMLARMGGDEFAVLVPEVHSREDVAEIARRLGLSLRDSISVDGHQIYGSASIGIALYPADASDEDGLLSAADTAMYAAKNSHLRAGVEHAGSPNIA